MCAKAQNEPVESPLDSGMKLIRECPLCKQEYDFDQIKVIEEDTGAHLVHITCIQCSNAMLAVIMVNQLGMSTVGMVTDLMPDDVVRLRAKQPVSSDDVLTFHEFLSEESHFETALMRSVKT